jgi:cytochrome c oxidase subunit 2
VKPAHHLSHNSLLEFIWTAIPSVLVLVIFVWGWLVYKESVNPPANAMEVRVIAKSWSWTFQYDDGRTTTNDLYVPVKTPIKLLITSEKNDVLHSFYVPNFRIKKDAVPGMFSVIWFQTDAPGQHIIFCAEYCGADHSNMMGRVIALAPEDYQKWKWGGQVDLPPPIGIQLPKKPEMKSSQLIDTHTSVAVAKSELAKHGQKLVQSMGCVGCHTDDGSRKIGPSYKGMFGREVQLADGSRVVADENWIREKIEMPQRRTVKGYEGLLMPSYSGQMTAEELNAVIAYLKSLN